MFSPFKTCLAFFPLPYLFYTPVALMTKSDRESDAISLEPQYNPHVVSVNTVLSIHPWYFKARHKKCYTLLCFSRKKSYADLKHGLKRFANLKVLAVQTGL